MAESGSASNSGTPPPSLSSSAAVPPDWEVLTMSMSASAVGKPGDSVSEIFNPQLENSSNPSLAEGDFSSGMWTDPSASRDESFTAGWKPHLSASSDLYGYVAEQKHQEDPSLPSEGAETYFDSNASINMAEGLLVSEIVDGDLEERVLAHDLSMDGVKTSDEALKDKVKRKGPKRPNRSSTVVWSVAVIASVVGIVFLGNRLRLAYYQNQELQIQLSVKDEKLNEMLLQVNRLKEVLGDHHKVPVSGN
ncbi:hypothetical protein GOP47_0007955 [Adiantum capillus-veneris]|uniref:Uncharacterized protein n=1 Tax=Adiantum capillus-veneris TaxID=13818 RepID=A0A9D4ZM03_ADICA|nr:hypothetical protein GOP47_0007955 [Adiantum capillus-veneris]